MTGVRGATAPKTANPSSVSETANPSLTDSDTSNSGQPAPENDPQRLVVTFADNRHVTHLLGPHDVHLAQIEQRLDIDAHANGNVITLSGDVARIATAKTVLEKLYERISAGEDIGRGDIDGLIRHAHSEKPQATGMAQIRTRKRIVTARTPMQSRYIEAIEKNDLVFGLGPAGTGKTYIAVVAAASYLERGKVDRIILSRPAVEAGERLGFLPGDMRDKVDPYLRPLYDALYDVLPPEKVEKDIEAGIIEVAPLAFMRGRTLANAFVILDEAQNTTTMQMKMFLTRLGENSKMVVTGDPTQIDLPKGQASGLIEAVGYLKGIDEISRIRFTASDVVRRDLVARIVAAYERAEAGRPGR